MILWSTIVSEKSSKCFYNVGRVNGPGFKFRDNEISSSGINIGIFNSLKACCPGRFIVCFEPVSPCSIWTCSVIVFDTASGISGFPPDILPLRRKFFQKMVYSSFRSDGSKNGRLYTKSPWTLANCSTKAASIPFLNGSTALHLFSSTGQLSPEHELPKKNIGPFVAIVFWGFRKRATTSRCRRDDLTEQKRRATMAQ